jgi:hypothetical protein
VAVELLAGTVLACLVLPFLLGYWIAHGELAALAFIALGFSVLVRQVTAHSASPFGAKIVIGVLISSAISATSAYVGGRLRRS